MTTATTTTAATHAAASLSSLCQSNIRILRQKLGLMDALVMKLGYERALRQYKSICPIVGASIGQHIRHSMDHVELAVKAAAAAADAAAASDSSSNNSSSSSSSSSSALLLPQIIHYDLRIRGGADEYDMEAAKVRIQNVMQILANLQDNTSCGDKDDNNNNNINNNNKNDNNNNNNNNNNNDDAVVVHLSNVSAQFMLSGQEGGVEYALPSTVARELGFAAHHAIHHLAMARVIVQVSAGLHDNDLPPDFGRAPSTVHYDLTKIE